MTTVFALSECGVISPYAGHYGPHGLDGPGPLHYAAYAVPHGGAALPVPYAATGELNFLFQKPSI